MGTTTVFGFKIRIWVLQARFPIYFSWELLVLFPDFDCCLTSFDANYLIYFGSRKRSLCVNLEVRISFYSSHSCLHKEFCRLEAVLYFQDP